MKDLFHQTEQPRVGDPGCTLDQMFDWICERSRECPSAVRCAAQVIGDSWCFDALEKKEKAT